MNKLLAKLLTCILALVISTAMVVVSSYAWLTMSGAPEVDGIQIHIGGSNTIMVAADIAVQNANGSISHYPDVFSRTLNFAEHETYAYLNEVAGLLPVSTADGMHWVLPSYYGLDDAEVEAGLAYCGQMKDFSDFELDASLRNGNLLVNDKSIKGNYIYFDFWVVSPGADYQLHVSTGDVSEDSGSYVIGMAEPVRTEDGYALEEDNTAAASVRLGFLANSDWGSYSDVASYVSSEGYDDRYVCLVGQYQEPGEHADNFSAARNRFTVYEPNGDLHADGTGNYIITEPLAPVDGEISPVDISDRLTVQLTNRWKTADDGSETLLAREFATAIMAKNPEEETPESLYDYLYRERLQNQLQPYVQRAWFVTSTSGLYSAANNGQVASDSPALRLTSGATEDVYIVNLQKDTPQRIRLFIWLEGQDADCVDMFDLSGFAISLELAGSND